MLKISRYCAKILKVAISLDKDQQNQTLIKELKTDKLTSILPLNTKKLKHYFVLSISIARCQLLTSACSEPSCHLELNLMNVMSLKTL